MLHHVCAHLNPKSVKPLVPERTLLSTSAGADSGVHELRHALPKQVGQIPKANPCKTCLGTVDQREAGANHSDSEQSASLQLQRSMYHPGKSLRGEDVLRFFSVEELFTHTSKRQFADLLSEAELPR